VLCLHAAGLGELVAAALSVDAQAHVLYTDDSAVLVDTKTSPVMIGRLPYLKNCFAVVGSVPRRGDLRQSVDAVSRQVPRWSLRLSGQPFRLMFSEDGRLATVPTNVRGRLESAVSQATGGRFTPRGGGDEYWMITRRDLDQVLFTQRLPRPAAKSPPKGALAQDVASLIVSATGPNSPTDVVLDPFAGTGALIAARVQQPFREAICADIGYSDGSVRLMQELTGRSGVRQLAEDVRTLPSVRTRSVDVVVTDPPWGEFDQTIGSTDAFFAQALGTIRRVLRPGGRLAMLIARQLEDQLCRQWTDHELEPVRSFRLLVNGHPATLIAGHR
jgi:hypothetical protein